MLQLESTSVIDDFMRMINKDYRIKWRNMYQDIKPDELYTDTDRIVRFFKEEKDLRKTNKYDLVKDLLFMDKNYKDKKLNPFVNFLWIKQLLYADSIDKNPKITVDYQTEINAIIDKMRGFFSDKEKVQAFFIVTDGKQKPYVLSPQDNFFFLNKFTDEFDTNKLLETEIKKLKTETIKEENGSFDDKENELGKKIIEQNNLPTKTLIDFLNGMRCNTSDAYETTAEFIFDDEWKNIYDNKVVNLKFIPTEYEYKWLYLIRISKFNENRCEFETLGLLGFYSKEDLRGNVLPKQLLMLLRQNMGAFIKKHHKNDEFSELVKSNYEIYEAQTSDHDFNNIANRLKHFSSDPDFIYLHSLIANSEHLRNTIKLGKIVKEIDKETFNVKKEIEQAYKMVFDYRKCDNIQFNLTVDDSLSANFYLVIFRAVLFEYLQNANTCLFKFTENVELTINVLNSSDDNSIEVTIINKVKNTVTNGYNYLSRHKTTLNKYGYIQKGKKGLYKNLKLLYASTGNYPNITFSEVNENYFDFIVKFKI
jgi:hypothetical protein